MQEKFNIMQFIKHLCSFSPRLGVNEQKAADYLESVLSKHNIPFISQKFKSSVPIYKKAVLYADRKKIDCKGACFVGGKIEGKNNILSSYTDIDTKGLKSIISFSPFCKEIALGDFYPVPAVAIKCSDIIKIQKAETVKGEVIVKKSSFTSENILVGNTKDPKYLAFAHYDSLGKGGAMDNASAVASLMYIIINSPEVLEKALFVFVGSEEVTFDKRPKYSGRGFRIFENKYSNLLKRSKAIYIIDGVGSSKPRWFQSFDWLWITFQVRMLKRIMKKVSLLHGDPTEVIKIVHSDLDTIDNIKEKYVLEVVKILLKKIK